MDYDDKEAGFLCSQAQPDLQAFITPSNQTGKDIRETLLIQKEHRHSCLFRMSKPH